jgi:hypothetical protein
MPAQEKATGKDVIQAIVNNMQGSLEPLLYRTLAPSHFDVYLHEDDYERLAGVFPAIQEETRRALDEALSALNQPRRSLLPGSKKAPHTYEAADKAWSIKFHADADEDLAPGDVLVDSRLSLPSRQEYGIGAKTQRLVTLHSGGETRKLRSYEQPAEPADKPFARLKYQDREGRWQEYLMTSQEIAVGRGGKADYCDLQLDSPADVSRQHFYLRWDPETGLFYIQDVSRFGTALNEKQLALKEWTEVPDKARITLADKIAIEFERLS